MSDPWRGYYLTAYGIAVKHGFTGTEEEWLESLVGAAIEEVRHNEETHQFEWRRENSNVWIPFYNTTQMEGAAKAAAEAKESKEAALKAAEDVQNAALEAEENIERIAAASEERINAAEESAGQTLQAATAKAEEAVKIEEEAKETSQRTIEESNALLGEIKATEAGEMKTALDTHTANTTIHLTAKQKDYLNCPVLIQDYIGNGAASRDIKMLVTYPSFIIVWAQGLAPMNKKGDLEKYSVNWGIASNFATNRFYYSAGLKITQNGVLTVLKDTDDAASTSTLSFNLNQKYITYHIAYFGPYTT